MTSQQHERATPLERFPLPRIVGIAFLLSAVMGSPMAHGLEESSEPPGNAPTAAGPIENPTSPPPPRGYQSRPCGFDMNHDGIAGEPDDCHVCDASLEGGKIVAGTSDPDGDGIEEDLIYVDCEGGSDFNYCGRPGFRPCATIEYAWETRADGPDDGAEDIVCFTGTCRPNDFPFPPGFRGVPGSWTKAKQGSESRDWEFPKDPAMLVGWDLDNDGSYPPHDPDDISDLDGSGSRWAFSLNHFYEPNSYYEIAHFRVRDYGVHNARGAGGGFVKMFVTPKASSHAHLHDLSLQNINKDGQFFSQNITFNWFRSNEATHVALVNIESIDEGSYTFRGAADVFGDAIAGPWRFQNLSITAHGCSVGKCEPRRAWKTVAKLWGWVDGIEILDSRFDANVKAWKADSVTGIHASAFTEDWDIVNNEFVDWGNAVVAKGIIPESYGGNPRYTDDLVIRGNLMKNELWDGNVFVKIFGSGGNQEAVKDIWILNNIITSSLEPQAFVLIKQGNSQGPCVTNVRVTNNTFYGRAAAAIRVDDPQSSDENRFKRLRLRNNIFKGIAPGDINILADYELEFFDSDFNIFDADAHFKLAGSEVFTLPDWRALSGGDSSSLACSPAFRSPPFDLRLAGSDHCALDRGSSMTYLTSCDIEGDGRPYGPSWDIGADEWNGGFFWDSFESGDFSQWTY